MVRMLQNGEIVIHIEDSSRKGRVSMESFDIKEVRKLLDEVETLLFPNSKTNRPIISYSVEPGSVKNIFKTSKQAVVEFGAVISLISSQNSLVGIEQKMARSIENLQKTAVAKGYDIDINIVGDDVSTLQITPNTRFFIESEIWVDTMLFLYGTIVDAGGKTNSNIHIVTSDGKSYLINTSKEQLHSIDKNLLYREFGIQVTGKQRIDSGEIDDKSLFLVSIFDYDSNYDEKYIKELVCRAKYTWSDILDVDDWVRNMRDYE